MTRLDLELRIARPDEFYEALVETHRGLSDEDSRLLNARLILLLANQVGDMGVLMEALGKAAEAVRKTP